MEPAAGLESPLHGKRAHPRRDDPAQLHKRRRRHVLLGVDMGLLIQYCVRRKTMARRAVLATITLLAAYAANVSSPNAATQNIDDAAANRIFASFDPSRPEGGPFPSDIFTVED